MNTPAQQELLALARPAPKSTVVAPAVSSPAADDGPPRPPEVEKGAPTDVAIYEVSREWTTWVWLCTERHVAARKDAGWTVKRVDGPPVDRCTDCELETQATA